MAGQESIGVVAMNTKSHPSGIPTLMILPLLISTMILHASTQGRSRLQERRLPKPDLGLEIVLPNKSVPSLKLAVLNGRRSTTIVRRQLLAISDPILAADFTGVDIWADGEAGAIRVRLSIVYNDLSNQEWWKEKKETIVGSFLVHEGESIRPAELGRFGIDPFEMRVIEARPVVFEPGKGPRITNRTTTLEVVGLEKSLDRYRLLLQNNSGKNVAAYTISTTNGSLSMSDPAGPGLTEPVIAAGASSHGTHLTASDVEEGGITISVVVFEDGSFEGDPELAARFMARWKGITIQAPQILPLIEQTLEADDVELQAAFEKLEADLWAMPEAIDKHSALELLKTAYPSFDPKTVDSLYEELKGGLYSARNRALGPIGEVKRRIEEAEGRQDSDPAATRTLLLRETLTRIKSDFEKLRRFNTISKSGKTAK